jgi:O-antigen/teichoic acid export membrane protein
MKNNQVQHSLGLLVKSSFLVFIGLVISKLLTYAYRVIIARYYGVEIYGVYSLALVCAGWFIAFASLGLSEGCLRYFALYSEKKNLKASRYLMRLSLVFLTASSIVAGLLLFFFSEKIAVGIFHSPDLTIFLQWLSLAVPLTILALPFIMGMRAYERIGAYTGIYSILQNILKVILIVAFILLGIKGSSSILASHLIALGGVLLVSYIYVRTKISELFVGQILENKKRGSLMKEIFSYSGPMLFYSILVSLLYWIDSLSLGYYKTPLEVGLYNAAVPLALLLTLAPELFNQLFSPMMTRHYASNRVELAKQLIKQVSKWILAINIPIGIILLVYPKVVLNILFGSAFIAAAPALQILAISNIYASIGLISATFVSATGRSRLVLMNMVIAAVVNFALNSVFVPMPTVFGMANANGLVGAAFATLISIIILNTLFIYQTARIIKAFPFRFKMLLVLFSAIIPTAVLVYLDRIIENPSIPMLILIGIGFVFLYIINVVLFRAFDKYDKEIISKIKDKFRSIVRG